MQRERSALSGRTEGEVPATANEIINPLAAQLRLSSSIEFHLGEEFRSSFRAMKRRRATFLDVRVKPRVVVRREN